jgi:glycosyltransferase involved in cell wall biosynthesis
LSAVLPSKIVCCSELAQRTHLELGYRGDKIVVIPNGFDLSQFKPDAEARASLRAELGLAPDALVVGQVGRFHAQKDHHNFFQAAHRVLARLPEVQFVLCGRDVTWQNAQLCEWVGADRARFHILGERGDIPRISAALDVACSSSSYGEAFPLVIGEAMAAGVPCVVTDCGDSALMVGETGRVVPIRDPAAFAEAIGGLLALGPDGRAALGAAARRRIAERFELRQIAARYQQLWRGLAGR